jgi:hypothetical protein
VLLSDGQTRPRGDRRAGAGAGAPERDRHLLDPPRPGDVSTREAKKLGEADYFLSVWADTGGQAVFPGPSAS